MIKAGTRTASAGYPCGANGIARNIGPPRIAGPKLELATCEHEHDREHHGSKEVEERRARCDVLEVRVAEHVAETLAQLDAHPAARLTVGARRPVLAHA